MTVATAIQQPTRSDRQPISRCEFDSRQIRASVDQAVGPGPLLAVCGVAGGVGVTSLSFLIALFAARQRAGAVLVTDTGGPSANLAALAGVEVSRTLCALAEQRAAGVPLGAGIYATVDDGLRVLASGPEFDSPGTDDNVRALLTDARKAHALTVIDCGALTRTVQQTAAAAATHVAWVLSATRPGVERARRLLEAAPVMVGNELIVARCDGDRPSAPVRQLRQLAADRCTPLVLMPNLTELGDGGFDGSLDAAQVSVQAVLGWLAR